MKRRDLVLAILSAADGRAYSPVQLQKSVFLITKKIPDLVEGPKFNFVPYDYGPFDSHVYADAEALKASGDAIISASTSGNWKMYSASDEGIERGKAILRGIDTNYQKYIIDICNWVRSQTFSSLVKSVYTAYPEMREKSIFKD